MPAALIRNPHHVGDVDAIGATTLLLDLEKTDAVTLTSHLERGDAVVFAAGLGAGNERKLTVNRGDAILLANADELAGIRRYVLVSSMGAFQVYLAPRARQTRSCGSVTSTGRSPVRTDG